MGAISVDAADGPRDVAAWMALVRSQGALLDSLGIGLCAIDAAGRVQAWNPSLLRIFPEHEGAIRAGEPHAQMLRRLPPALHAVAGVSHAGTGEFEHRGQRITVSAQALPGSGWLQACRATPSRPPPDAGQRALQLTLDSMGQGLSAIGADGRLAFWNRRYSELLDLPESLLATHPTMEQLVRFQIERGDFGPDFAFVDALARGYVAIGDREHPLNGPQTYLRRTREGHVLQVVTLPVPDGGVVRTFTDVTELLRAQEDLASERKLLSTLVSNLPDRVWLKDMAGVYRLTNPANERHHGMATGAMVGRTGAQLFGAAGEAHEATDREAVAAGRDRTLRFERRELCADGEVRDFEVVKAGLYEPDGSLSGILGIAHDVTLRKRAEAALVAAKEAAQEASDAKTRFLSGMSHEIRTPMNAVLGMLTLLRGTDLTERQDDYAAKAEGAARSLLALLNDVLDFSKIEAGKMQLDLQPFSLQETFAQLSVILSANVGDKHLEVLYDLDPAVPDALVGDDMRLRQVLINLGGNAVKFTTEGEVVVSTRLLARADGQATVEFAVTDSGIGISEDDQHRLTGDYVQASGDTARRFGGTGLGLAICRRLLELMGSRLDLSSQPGRGSRFSFLVTLPTGTEASPVPAAAERRRVLVVDDNALARRTLGSLMQSLGWQVELAGGAEEGIRCVERSRHDGRAFDAVFMDWRMPGTDGWEASRRIRQSGDGRPPLIVMVTAKGRETLAQRAASERALIDAFLVKPVTPAVLRDTLRRLESPAAPPSSRAAAPRPLEGRRLLLVEDNPVNQQVAVELLRGRGAQVDVAGDGRQAVDRLAAGAVYDAVLMDMLMPVMDGLQATRAIRAMPGRGQLPIIAMTANAMDTDRAACLAAGMDDHLAKPLVLADVVDAILRHVQPQQAHAAAGDHAAAEAVFDLDGAVERLGGDRALIVRLLPTFERNLRKAADDLQAPWQPPAGEDLCRVLHTLKGSAGTMGATALATAAGRAEQELRAGAGPQATGDVLRLLDRTLQVVRQASAQEAQRRK